MLTQTTELVTYSKATEIAAKYAAATAEIRRLALELGAQVAELKAAFQSEDSYSSNFDIRLDLHRNQYAPTETTVDEMLVEIQRSAWKVLIEKIGIKKLMSAKDRENLDRQLQGRHCRNNYNSDPIPALPELTAESLMSVFGGFVQSAPDYLEAKIRECYQWLVPTYFHGGHVTNKRDRVGKKVIRSCCVERGWGGTLYRVNHRYQGELVALDSIFHAIDGKGVLEGHEGPLVAAIQLSEDGTGETEYFRFKCFKNSNIHIEFKRDDLLAIFNRVAVDGHRLGGEAARK